MTISDDSYVGIKEIAQYLGVQVVTIRKWLSSNKNIPSHKIGKQWKFKKSEIDTWVNSGESAH